MENNKLQQLRERYEDARAKVIRSNASKEQLERTLSNTVDEIRALGINPDDLDSELKKISEKVDSLYQSIEKNLDEVDLIADEIKKG